MAVSITLGNLKTIVLTVPTNSGSTGTIFKRKLMQPLPRLIQLSSGPSSPDGKSARLLLQPQLPSVLRDVLNEHADEA